MFQHYLIMTRTSFEHLGTDSETAFRHSFALAQPTLPPGTTIPSTWSDAAAMDEVINDWLRSFNDPRLEALVAEAITYNLLE